MRIFLAALASILLSVAAQFTLKAGMNSLAVKQALTQPLGLRNAWDIISNALVLSGFTLYALGAVVWLTVLAQWDVSKAYPLVGLGFIFTLIVGLMQGEQVSLVRATGVLLIASGVYLVSRS